MFDAKKEGPRLGARVPERKVQIGLMHPGYVYGVDDLPRTLALLERGFVPLPVLVLEGSVQNRNDTDGDCTNDERDENQPVHTCHGFGRRARHLLSEWMRCVHFR